jgi:hypothetical protein
MYREEEHHMTIAWRKLEPDGGQDAMPLIASPES